MSMADDYDCMLPDWLEEEEVDIPYDLVAVEHETPKAYYVRVKDGKMDQLFWVPKSQVYIEKHTLYVPAWLDRKLNMTPVKPHPELILNRS